MSWGVLLVGDQPARQRCADRGQRLGAQQAENRQNRQCQASIPRKEACQNQALLEATIPGPLPLPAASRPPSAV
jgi:hypothetical protein